MLWNLDILYTILLYIVIFCNCMFKIYYILLKKFKIEQFKTSSLFYKLVMLN